MSAGSAKKAIGPQAYLPGRHQTVNNRVRPVLGRCCRQSIKAVLYIVIIIQKVRARMHEHSACYGKKIEKPG